MDQSFLATIRQKLTEREQELAKEIADVSQKTTTGGYTTSFPDYGTDDDENSAEVETYTTNLSVEQTLLSAMKDVRGALKRLDDGTYGVCKYCGQQIDERRLLARPWSSSCISCKEDLKSQQ